MPVKRFGHFRLRQSPTETNSSHAERDQSWGMESCITVRGADDPLCVAVASSCRLTKTS